MDRQIRSAWHLSAYCLHLCLSVPCHLPSAVSKTWYLLLKITGHARLAQVTSARKCVQAKRRARMLAKLCTSTHTFSRPCTGSYVSRNHQLLAQAKLLLSRGLVVRCLSVAAGGWNDLTAVLQERRSAVRSRQLLQTCLYAVQQVCRAQQCSPCCAAAAQNSCSREPQSCCAARAQAQLSAKRLRMSASSRLED